MEEEPKTIEQLEEEKKARKMFLDCFLNIKQTLKKYMDMEERNYSIVALWILGTYFHEKFPTYPYLFVNAMKGSGKTRLLKLISKFSKDGEILNSLTEAVLFRERGTLCIDEFEGITRVGKENLRELLNSAYKQGTKVKRMKKSKTSTGEEQVIETFDVYRPIAMANIWGMEDVLGDRCITLILEKSDDKVKSRLIEVFDKDFIITTTLTTLSTLTTLKNPDWCSLCSVEVLWGMYMGWNVYTEMTDIHTNTHSTLSTLLYTDYTNNKKDTLTTLSTFFKKIYDSEINGRNLELSLSLFLIAFELDLISKENFLEKSSIFDEVLETFKLIFKEKKEEEFAENKDILIIDFLSQEPEKDYYESLSELFERFREFSHLNEEWVNKKWFGYRLRTLNLVKKKRRVARGIEIIPDYKKAQEKIKTFHSNE